jgi:hypothetical protein
VEAYMEDILRFFKGREMHGSTVNPLKERCFTAVE